MKKRTYYLSAFFVVVMLVASLIAQGGEKPSSASSPSPITRPSGPAIISLYVGETGSAGYNRGIAMKQVLEQFSNVKVTTEQLVGAQFSEYMRKGEVDMAGYNAYDLVNAYNGNADFKTFGPNHEMRNMFTIQPTLGGYMMRADRGIKTIQDLRGKKIYADMPSRPLLLYQVQRHLEYYKILGQVQLLKWSDHGEGVNGVTEGRADGFFTSIAITPQLAQAVRNVVVLDFPKREIVEYVNKPLGSWVFQWVKLDPNSVYVKTYGIPAGINVTGWTLNFVVRERVPDDVVYTILKTLYEHPKELVAVHKQASQIQKDVALSAPIMPFHPGAVKYFKDQGMWTDELEAMQQKMLTAAGKKR